MDQQLEVVVWDPWSLRHISVQARGLRDLDGTWGVFLEEGEEFGLGDHSVGSARHVGPWGCDFFDCWMFAGSARRRLGDSKGGEGYDRWECYDRRALMSLRRRADRHWNPLLQLSCKLSVLVSTEGVHAKRIITRQTFSRRLNSISMSGIWGYTQAALFLIVDAHWRANCTIAQSALTMWRL